MGKQNHDQNKNPNQNKNSNPNQNQSQNQKFNPKPHSNPNEEFDLRETAPRLGGGRFPGNDRVGTAFDLVEQMHYLFVRVVKAKELPKKHNDQFPDPYVELQLGNFRGHTKHFEKVCNPEWNQVFAILKDQIQATSIGFFVKDKNDNNKDHFIGNVCFDVCEVPKRVPPDSPLAPQWYRLDNKEGKRSQGELMLAVWMGTQADEAFPEAWHLDASAVSGDGVANIRSKVYLSPRLWYVRVNVIEAQSLRISDRNFRQLELFVKVELGKVVLRTKNSSSRTPLWNEDLMFVVAEPFEEPLVLSLVDRQSANKDEVLGKCFVSLQNVEKRVDLKFATSRWFNLEKHGTGDNGAKNEGKLNSKIHLRICLEGGYHVLDELTHYSSDFRATARQLWTPSIGVLELGILSAQGLSSMKHKGGNGSTDSYCVAKYGQKWIRTRTIMNTDSPKWNEQYTWEVFDPCTVITIGVFDNQHLQGVDKGGGAKDSKLGKVRIRLSTLESDRVYTHSYPLIVLEPSGVKKMGEIQLAVRFTCTSLVNLLQMYTQPLLPIMHYLYPLSMHQIDSLRHQATQIVSTRLSRAEPPLRKEVVEYMLDVGSTMWSVRKSKANYCRIIEVMTRFTAFCRLFNQICMWKSPFITVLVHILLLVLVYYPHMILSTMCFTIFMIGISKYRFRPRHPPHMDIKLSLAHITHGDELDEEFDTFPTSKQGEVLKMRYDRLRCIGSRIQVVIGDLATQGERVHNLLSWRDPRATSLFLILCFISAIVLYVTPCRVIAVLMGFYVLRHPRFRHKLPSTPLSFFRRLPARSDSLL
ncbi:hypothetical protein DCAR_0934136 [Daucus carota subsp. sativus]|uniref:Uncharacterized protein n=1 Tax=Daucus carota subsp. sativus TaxID=79200 RepID=A0A175YEV2_DAUCS|nr:PREDICTED: protein QUIRKY-like [Daucus carota subsp. sativus]XP_017227301.1 PREDICTED: protein QUIRKY-like [Daucus carota subsp. sativus]WOH14616.1 hypothetical protein DCAR_0934136 [Daucus carota subsp. sativus]